MVDGAVDGIMGRTRTGCWDVIRYDYDILHCSLFAMKWKMEMAMVKWKGKGRDR